jgi:hypothetical protein
MNRKRKVLTVAGLVAFAVIVWAHIANEDHIRLTTLLVFGAFYAGLYALMGGEDKPRNLRRIIKITSLIVIILITIAGSIGAILYALERETQRQRNIEHAQRAQAEKIEKEKREEAKRIAEEAKQREKEKREQAKKIEEEASRHRIKRSEIDLIDMDLQCLNSFEELETVYDIFLGDFPIHKTHRLTARIRNRSAHALNSITLQVRLHEKEGSSDILGEETVQIPVYVPPHQTRAINATLNFGAAPKLTEYALTYAVIEIRGGIKYLSTDPTAGLTERYGPASISTGGGRIGPAREFDSVGSTLAVLPTGCAKY